MPNTIQQIKKDNTEKIETTLDVKIYRKISENLYIVVDNTAHALLETSQELQENIVYKLLKPQFLAGKFKANPKLKILRTKLTMDGKKMTQADLKQYEGLTSSLSENQQKKKNKNNFTQCEAQNGPEKIEMLTLLIISKSRDIDGQYGKYNIITAKDCEGIKNSLNIYHDKANIVQPEKILTFTILKKTSFKTIDTDFHRLATVWNTRIFEAKEHDQLEFKDVLLGDEKFDGIILGYDDLNIYESCIKCLTKLNDDFCKRCNRKVDDQKSNDFYVTLYAQNINDEEQIMDIFAFRRDLSINNEKHEEFEKILDEMTAKSYTIEYNKPRNDKEGNDQKHKLVKIEKLQENTSKNLKK